MTLNEWMHEVWVNAEDHGFHAPGTNNEPPSWVANLHGEVSEFWEAYRRGTLKNPCDKKGLDLTCAEEELADIIIRLEAFAEMAARHEMAPSDVQEALSVLLLDLINRRGPSGVPVRSQDDIITTPNVVGDRGGKPGEPGA